MSRQQRRKLERELDIESVEALGALLRECGADGGRFAGFVAGEGRRELEAIRREAEAAGVFGVPSFLLDDGDLYWGREHLPRVRELLEVARP
jgi:2-hydroxychromene-2-carboxylate isomerase